MNYDIKITSKGQITIPQKIRKKLSLKTGEYLRAEIINGKIVLKPIPLNYDETVLMQYAEVEGKKSIGLEKTRELIVRSHTNMGAYVRKTREEEADGGR